MFIVFLQISSSPLRSETRPEACHFQAWRLQRRSMERGQAQAPIPSGHLHDPCGRTVALDATRVRALLYSLLVTVRSHLVAHHFHAWRPLSSISL